MATSHAMLIDVFMLLNFVLLLASRFAAQEPIDAAIPTVLKHPKVNTSVLSSLPFAPAAVHWNTRKVNLQRQTLPLDGAAVTLTCNAVLNNTLPVAWTKNEHDELLASRKYTMVANGQLTINNATETDAGIYTCTSGSLYEAIELLVPPAAIMWNTTTNEDKVFTGHAGGNIRFTGMAFAKSAIKISWLFNHTNRINSTNKRITITSRSEFDALINYTKVVTTLHISNLSVNDTGHYNFNATPVDDGDARVGSTVSLPAMLVVRRMRTDIQIDSPGEPENIGYAGNRATFACRVTYPAPNTRIRWAHNGRPLLPGGDNDDGRRKLMEFYDDKEHMALAGSLIDIVALHDNDTGTYSCIVTNGDLPKQKIHTVVFHVKHRLTFLTYIIIAAEVAFLAVVLYVCERRRRNRVVADESGADNAALVSDSERDARAAKQDVGATHSVRR